MINELMMGSPEWFKYWNICFCIGSKLRNLVIAYCCLSPSYVIVDTRVGACWFQIDEHRISKLYLHNRFRTSVFIIVSLKLFISHLEFDIRDDGNFGYRLNIIIFRICKWRAAGFSKYYCREQNLTTQLFLWQFHYHWHPG